MSERADERERAGNWRAAAAAAGGLVNVGLAISAILTVIYLMLLVDAAGPPAPYGLLFGLLWRAGDCRGRRVIAGARGDDYTTEGATGNGRSGHDCGRRVFKPDNF